MIELFMYIWYEIKKLPHRLREAWIRQEMSSFKYKNVGELYDRLDILSFSQLRYEASQLGIELIPELNNRASLINVIIEDYQSRGKILK